MIISIIKKQYFLLILVFGLSLFFNCAKQGIVRETGDIKKQEEKEDKLTQKKETEEKDDEQEYEYFEIINDNVKIYSDETMKKEIGKLNKEDVVKIIKSKNKYYMIQSINGTTGWVKNDIGQKNDQVSVQVDNLGVEKKTEIKQDEYLALFIKLLTPINDIYYIAKGYSEKDKLFTVYLFDNEKKIIKKYHSCWSAFSENLLFRVEYVLKRMTVFNLQGEKIWTYDGIPRYDDIVYAQVSDDGNGIYFVNTISGELDEEMAFIIYINKNNDKIVKKEWRFDGKDMPQVIEMRVLDDYRYFFTYDHLDRIYLFDVNKNLIWNKKFSNKITTIGVSQSKYMYVFFENRNFRIYNIDGELVYSYRSEEHMVDEICTLFNEMKQECLIGIRQNLVKIDLKNKKENYNIDFLYNKQKEYCIIKKIKTYKNMTIIHYQLFYKNIFKKIRTNNIVILDSKGKTIYKKVFQGDNKILKFEIANDILTIYFRNEIYKYKIKI